MGRVEDRQSTRLAQGNAILSACYHLAIGDTARALDRLFHGDEITLAMAVSKVFKEDVDYVTIAMAQRFERRGMWHEALGTCAFHAFMNWFMMRTQVACKT